MAAPGQDDEDVYTLCLGTDPQVSKDAARLRAHDTHDAGVRLALGVDDQARLWLEDYVNHGKIPKPEEIKLFWNAFVDKHMDLEGDDHGHCGNPLDEKKYHVFLNFNTEAHKKRSPGQTRGDRIALNNHTFVFLRNYAVYIALLEGGTPEGELTPAIAAEAFDARVSYSDYYQVSCDGTPECPGGNKWVCFEKQLLDDAKARGLSGKTNAEKLCVHNLQARSALAIRAIHSVAAGNEKLTVLMASDRSNDKLFKNPNRKPIDALLVHIFLTSHPSTFPAQLRHPGIYPREELERITKHFLEFLQVVFAGAVLSNGTQLSLPSSAEEFKLFFKLSGRGDLSPAEIEALLEALHEGRVRAGTRTAYSKGLDARGKCVAMVERGGHNVLPATELIHSTILRLASDRDWDMHLPGGARLSEVCDIDNVELRYFYLAHALSPVEIVLHEPALVEYRRLTEEEEEAVRRDADGDDDEALKNAAKAKVKQFDNYFRAPRARAETALIRSDQAVPSLLWTRDGTGHLTQLIENTIHNLAKDLSYKLPANRSLPNNRKLSDNVVERQCQITHALKPKDLLLANPALGPLYYLTVAEKKSMSEAEQKTAKGAKAHNFRGTLFTVRNRAAAAKKKAAEQAAADQAAADQAAADQGESFLVESSEDFVPQYGMRVGVEFDYRFDLGTITGVNVTGVNEEGSSFRLSVWFDDGSEYDDVMYPAADVRFVVGSDGRPVFDAAHLAFVKNPRYARMMKQRAEKNILLAPSGIAVRPSTITPTCSDDSSGNSFASSVSTRSSKRPKGSLEDIASLDLENTEYTTVPAVKRFKCAARSFRFMTVPGYGMRVEVMFDGLFYEGTIICATEETNSFDLTVWFDDSECRNVSYPAPDVRLIKGLAGDIVLDVAHLAFLKNPRYLEITQEAAENGIRLAPSGHPVGASLDEKKLIAKLTLPAVSSGESKSKRISLDDGFIADDDISLDDGIIDDDISTDDESLVSDEETTPRNVRRSTKTVADFKDDEEYNPLVDVDL